MKTFERTLEGGSVLALLGGGLVVGGYGAWQILSLVPTSVWGLATVVAVTCWLIGAVLGGVFAVKVYWRNIKNFIISRFTRQTKG